MTPEDQLQRIQRMCDERVERWRKTAWFLVAVVVVFGAGLIGLLIDGILNFHACYP